MVDLPEPDRPVNHSTAGFWPFGLGARILVHVERLPMDVGRAPQTEIDHAGADRRIGEAVDQDEAARVAVLVIGIEGDGLRRGDIAVADFVQMQGLAGQMVERVDVDLVLQFGDLDAGTVVVPIFRRYWRPGSISSSAIQSRCAANWSETSGRAARRAQNVAARDVDFVGQRQRHGVAGARLRPDRRPW